ncbi:hypothetical protein U9Y48_24705 [Escherichia coli]|uniref:hypothetical protein n=1 Tax=Escherichia TaxID=561 RepID=UPI0007A5B6AF|nr:hypothetical protein [Escherichia coli]MEC9637501.1 hypothetical protein [Escherichia marmotae]MCK3238967.1 hypothetical protein [Escherichia coli]MCK3373471.1 hypothetical protein [Escherichia coli]MCK3593712.1 hypothetical protein [Escherichia coli]MCK3611324.1 hypothetical protein [Escherichia coli]
MSLDKLYYIYIDTKIEGAIEQLLRYFRTQVFKPQYCIAIYCKYYKEIEFPFSRKFAEHNICFKFIRKFSEMELKAGKVVFYLFNAQSNCRVVANRNLVHIFVTHGESNKLASVKPIIRIYDYVITAGDAGIDRYLKAGIFSPYDIQNDKIIKLGNTFTGDNLFTFNPSSRHIVYAPTWEGGIPEENYCSISKETAYQIARFCKKNNISTIYIQIHPNLGHRDIKYKKLLNDCTKLLIKFGLKIVKIKNDIIERTSFLYYFTCKKNTPIEVSFALTDISAMEVQFHSKGIPCAVIMNKKISHMPRKMGEYYEKNSFNHVNTSLNFNKDMDDIKKYLISYSYPFLKEMSSSERVLWLCKYATHLHKEKNNELSLLY